MHFIKLSKLPHILYACVCVSVKEGRLKRCKTHLKLRFIAQLSSLNKCYILQLCLDVWSGRVIERVCTQEGVIGSRKSQWTTRFVNNLCFFLILKFSSGHDVIHTPTTFPVWGFIMTMVIVIYFARERKTAPNDYTPELLNRIVQSPTKLNDEI